MSKNINVNPDHYKVAGRERQGEDIVQERHKTRYSKAQDDLDERAQQRSQSLRGMAERATAPGGEGKQLTREAARPPRSKSGTAKSGAARSGAKKGRATGSRKAASKSRPAKKSAAGKSAAKKGPARKAAARKPAKKSTSKRSAAAKRPARKK